MKNVSAGNSELDCGYLRCFKHWGLCTVSRNHLRQLFILHIEYAIGFLLGCHILCWDHMSFCVIDWQVSWHSNTLHKISCRLKENHKSAASCGKASTQVLAQIKRQAKPEKKEWSERKCVSVLTQWNRRNVQEHAAIDCNLLFCLRFVSCAEKQQSWALCQLSALLDEEASPGSMWERTQWRVTHPSPQPAAVRGGERPCPQCDNSFTLQHEAYSSTKPPLRPTDNFAPVKMAPHRERFV